MRHATHMPNTREAAEAWVEMTLASRDLGGPEKVPQEVFDRGWQLNCLVSRDPGAAVKVIADVTQLYPERDLASKERTDAQWVLEQLGMGPLETLLARIDENTLSLIESEAGKDGRFRWALCCSRCDFLPEDFKIRVQRASARSIY